jgi:predicted  nucleic acid-binding Zn-ribbon protein
MALAKNMTVGQRLKSLYDLQNIDSQLDGIQILKGELPVEVQDLEDEILGLETRINRLKEGVGEVEATISKYANSIKEAEALILKYEKQQDNVKNNREYEALMKEVELQKLDIQLANKRIKEAKITAQNKELTLKASEARLENKNENLTLKKQELSKIIKTTEKEEDKLNKRRDKYIKKIEPRLLKSYDRVRKAYRNGLGVVTVERDSCGGCYNKIPLQLQAEINKRKKIIHCEHCGRVLVDHDVMNAE